MVSAPVADMPGAARLTDCCPFPSPSLQSMCAHMCVCACTRLYICVRACVPCTDRRALGCPHMQACTHTSACVPPHMCPVRSPKEEIEGPAVPAPGPLVAASLPVHCGQGGRAPRGRACSSEGWGRGGQSLVSFQDAKYILAQRMFSGKQAGGSHPRPQEQVEGN